MSKPNTAFRLVYPDTNTVSALALHDIAGAALTPSSIVDGTGDPTGFKSKVIAFAAAVEPLFALPTFANPALPVAVYLTRDESGTLYKVMEETVFAHATPGRPTVGVTAAQEFLLYETLSTVNGGAVYTVKLPVDALCMVDSKGKDALTGEVIPGNDIIFRWFGKVPSLLEVEADVEDIADPRGYVPIPLANVTTYAESSVGMSMVQSEDQIVPRDGMGHTVNLRLRYNVNGDAGAWVALDHEFITYAIEVPLPPQSLTVSLLRDRNDVITDLVQASWVLDVVNPGTGVVISCTDYLGKKHTLYSSDSPATSCRIENVSRFIVQDEGPAVARSYRFHIQAVNISGKSSETYAPAQLDITSRVKEVVPLTPDEVAGTARDVLYAVLKAEVFADVLTALGSLPTEAQEIVSNAIDAMILRIKDVVMKGGSVDLMDFGVFAAKWTNERLGRNPATGEPVITPAYRSQGFTPSLGFKTGTKLGQIMTDAAAKLL